MWRAIQKLFAILIPILLIAVLLGVIVSYLNRWDSLVMVTLIPVWAWGLAGMLVSFLAWIPFRGTPLIVTFCLYLVAGIGFAEETHGLLRELGRAVLPSDDEESDEKKLLTIVSIDCIGKEEALEKVVDFDPDIVLVQGSPREKRLDEVADELFGAERVVAVHQKNAILARGEIIKTLPESDSSTLHVRLRIPSGEILDITNLDLKPCAPDFEIWKPTRWKELTEARVRNRRLVRSYLGENEISGSEIGRIVGGGFGTPPGDDVFRPLENAGLVDVFSVSGVGLGNTYPSNLPWLRLDQIWVSEKLVPEKTTTRIAPRTDHRVVVTELLMQ